MKIFFIIASILSAFFGVQHNKKFHADEKFIEKHGVKYFLIIGFLMVFLALVMLSFFVNFILD
jgi:hypothetical protein|tara:strand:+ start:65 stop:253 length:189 start_codon:yes stop_codon:yes gene_type:complete